jgi:hypothetical protein
MTDESPAPGCEDPPEAARRAFESHDAFEPRPTPGTYDCTTTPFDVVATATPHDNEGRDATLDLQIELPTLDAATEEDVGPAVADGWLDSLERHLTDAADVAEVDPETGPTVERVADQVELTVVFPVWNASSGVEDAKTIVEYAEGTYVQAIIPGYTYQDPVAGLLSQATERGGNEDDSGGRRGGTPL